ncbi:hypothetical protein ACLB2K_055273 [Fragaria x ananassa]
MHLAEKAADRWFMFKHEFPNSWLALADLLMREFSGVSMVDQQAALARLSQVGTIDQYMDNFTKLSRRAHGFSQQALLSFFLGGLNDSIKPHVKALRPTTLYSACELAKLFEQRDQNLKSAARATFVTRNTQATLPRANQLQPVGVGNGRLNPPLQPQVGAAPQVNIGGNAILAV